MKKLIQINSVCNGSTGKIMGEIQRCALDNNYKSLSLYGRRKGYKDMPSLKICNDFSVILHGGLTLLFNNHGMYSYFTTKKMIRILRKEKPDIIQLHNIHGYYLNYKLLFKYLKKEFKGKVFWTLHDAWSFTGHCYNFEYIKCNKWKRQCYKCPLINRYPSSIFLDTSKYEYKRKKELFNGVNNLTLITPSKWLKNLVSKSFLNYPVEVINNGIDLNIFHKVVDKSIKNKYSIPDKKKILLGVCNVWDNSKGFDDFIKLSSQLSEDRIIVLVGLSDKQIKKLPNNIIGIRRTNNQSDLVKIYSIADVFVNPTKEDNYPTVNLEAIACGTPVVTYDTGGCKEQIFENTGFVVNNFQEMIKKIDYCLKNDYKNKNFKNEKYLDKLDAKEKFNEYIKLYNKK